MSTGQAISPGLALLIGIAALGLLVLAFWPRTGLLACLQRWRDVTHRVFAEDALKHLHGTELARRRPTLQSLAGALQVTLNRAAEIVADLERRELVDVAGEELRLTGPGRRYALNILRAHRLWEQHLAEQTGVADTEWHREAERQEHFLSPQQADALAAKLGNPVYDPHGDPIPTAAGELAPRPGVALATASPGSWLRIVHMEDEPESVYAQLRALGLFPGMEIRLLDVTPGRVHLWVEGDEHVLAPVVAANISVIPVSTDLLTAEAQPAQRLSTLVPGQTARVRRILPQCRGAERRRLLDLGILPGTTVGAELSSLGGNLTAYRVRDSLIALRREQADLIDVGPPEPAPAT